MKPQNKTTNIKRKNNDNITISKNSKPTIDYLIDDLRDLEKIERYSKYVGDFSQS